MCGGAVKIAKRIGQGEKMRTCKVCNEAKEDSEFHANNITGWSTRCIVCRKRKSQAKAKHKYRELQALKQGASEAIKARQARRLEIKLKNLRSEYKRFTLINRDKIKQLQNKANNSNPVDIRTTNALNRRLAKQALVEAMYQGQIQTVMRGETPLTINEIWRNEYGDDTREESQETNHNDTE
tara:strand:+ start:1374 stop:1919 length:546 start_codon:yes stop_codon:yes gene_type:complete